MHTIRQVLLITNYTIMKKIFLFVVVAMFVACSGEEPQKGPAPNEIWYTTKGGETLLDRHLYHDDIVSDSYESGRGVMVFKNDIEKIDAYFFSGIPELVSMTLPNGVTTIEQRAFSNCPNLVRVDVPASVVNFGDAIFAECESLENIPVDRILTNKDCVAYCEFEDCEKLLTALIPEGVTEFEHHAFFGCESLVSVEIPQSVEIIGDGAFAHCKSLKSVVIPENVTLIESAAFYNCTSLESVYCKATMPPQLESIYRFTDNALGRKIYVPRESVMAYQTDPSWSSLADDIVGYDF